MSIHAKNLARIHARVELQSRKNRVNIDAIVEKLDEEPRLSVLAYSTLRGATKAAARELGRSIDGNYIEAQGADDEMKASIVNRYCDGDLI